MEKVGDLALPLLCNSMPLKQLNSRAGKQSCLRRKKKKAQQTAHRREVRELVSFLHTLVGYFTFKNVGISGYPNPFLCWEFLATGLYPPFPWNTAPKGCSSCQNNMGHRIHQGMGELSSIPSKQRDLTHLFAKTELKPPGPSFTHRLATAYQKIKGIWNQGGNKEESLTGVSTEETLFGPLHLELNAPQCFLLTQKISNTVHHTSFLLSVNQGCYKSCHCCLMDESLAPAEG